VTWAPPDDTGGAPITEYVIELSTPDDTRVVTTDDTRIAFTDLANGNAYALRIAAVNIAGTGPWSESVAGLVPRTIPSMTSGLSVVAADRSAVVSWSAPLDDGGAAVTGYVVEVTTPEGTREYPALDTSLTLLQLANDTPHAVRVAAINAAGQGPWSVTWRFRPRAPRVTEPLDVQLNLGKSKVKATWLAPELGEPLKYVVSLSVDGKGFRSLGTTESRSMDIPLRGRETMRIRVAAIDNRGRGPWSVATARLAASLR
jgi:hypothetical protein